MWLEPSFHGLQWPYMTKTGVGISGNLWVDSGYMQVNREDPSLTNLTTYLQQGRGVLRVTPTYTDGRFFIQGQVELVGNMCQSSTAVCITRNTVDTDDLWIRFGQWNAWDFKVGRFEGWELYHTGMGLDMYTLERLGAHNLGLAAPPPADLQAPLLYAANWLHDRPTAGLGVGYLAFHAYPANNLRFEVLGELGVDDITSPDTNGGAGQSQGYTYLGARPAFILDQGWMKVKVGGEYELKAANTQYLDTSTNTKQDSKASRTRKGVGGSVQFVIDPRAEFGGNFALGWEDNHEDVVSGDQVEKDSFSRNSVGAFGNLRLGSSWLLGAGINFTWQNNKFYNAADSPSPDYTAHMQGFGAIQYLLAGQLYIRAVIGYARADFVASDQAIDVWSNYMYSGRLRMMYLF